MKILNLIEGSEKYKLFLLPQVIIIIGKKGSGKTALGYKILEEAMDEKRKLIVAGVPKAKWHFIPGWLEICNNPDKLSNNSVVLTDEAGLKYNFCNSQGKRGLKLYELMALCRQKNITLIFVSQNTNLLTPEVLRQADAFIVKEPSLFQCDTERGFIKKLCDKFKELTRNMPRTEFNKLFYFFSYGQEALYSFELPSFWTEELSFIFR